MKFLKWISLFSIGVVILLELGAIFANLKEGYSIFYLFDLSRKFSMANQYFLFYWFAVLGLMFLSYEALKKNKVLKYSEFSEETLKGLNIKKALKDYQLLIGLIVIAFVLYQFTGSDLDRCIDGLTSNESVSESEATHECVIRMNR